MEDRGLDALARELPSLTRLRRFAGTLGLIPWFANLGEPLTAGARAAALTFADGLGFPDAGVAVLAEELLRADLTARALEVLSEDALGVAATMISDRVLEPAREAMEQAAFIWDIEDQPSQQLAVGAAVQAAHQAMLVLIAAGDPDFDADDHPFTMKFRLFEFGRWPVGIVGSTFNVF